MHKAQQGFTMIELVMVIVILGILAAVAMPRFYDLQTDARKAKADGIFGTVRSASAIAHSAYLVSGSASTGSVTIEAQTITLINGYPTANAAGIIAAANLDATKDNVAIGTGGAAAGSAITIQIGGAKTAANCQITYTAPAAGAAPTIVVDKSDC